MSTDSKPQNRLDAVAVLRGIFNDYQLEIAGPDVGRGIAAVQSLEEQLEALQDEKAKAQQFGGDRDDRIQALETALQRIYWNGCNGFVEETIIVVLSPEQRFAWAEAHNPAKEPS